MTTETEADRSAIRANCVSAWATGIGIGLAAFMIAWIVANRVTAVLMSVPAGPILAMTLAIVIGTTVSIRQGVRLSRPYTKK